MYAVGGLGCQGLGFWVAIAWVMVTPLPINTGTLGIYRGPNMFTNTSCGHHEWVEARPKP